MNNLDKGAIKALERSKPTSALDRVAEQTLKMHLEARNALNTHSYRAAMEALEDSSAINSRRVVDQLYEPISALRSRLDEFSQNIINQGLVAQKALAAVALYTHQNAILQSRELIASAAYNSVLQFQNSHRDMLAGFRSVLDRDLSPTLAAIQTMRTLGLTNISPEFSEYISEVWEAQESQEIPQTPAEIFQAKSKGLTAEQLSKLTLAVALLGIFISLFQAIQSSRPIRIDPVQVEQMRAQPEVTIDIFNIFSKMNEGPEYEVKRKVSMRFQLCGPAKCRERATTALPFVRL